jgi:hypothetical protein
MCLILDTDIIHKVFPNPAEDFEPVHEALTSGKAKLVYGGELGREYQRMVQFRRFLLRLARSSHQSLVSDASGGKATDFSLDSVEKMKFLGGGPLEEAGENVPQPGEANFSLVARCETKVVGAGWGSTAQSRPRGGE